MKKVVLSALAIALLAGCQANLKPSKSTSITKAQLTGDWVCSTKFVEWNTESINHVSLKADGTMSSKGSLIEPIGDPFFVYDTTGKGKWTFEQDRLTYVFSEETVKRNHADKVTEILKKDEKLNAYEENLFKVYSKRQNKKGNTVNLAVTGLSQNAQTGKDTLRLTQQTSSKSYDSICERK